MTQQVIQMMLIDLEQSIVSHESSMALHLSGSIGERIFKSLAVHFINLIQST
jgi:hypothetical protein